MASQGRKLQTWDEETHCDLLAAFYEVCSGDQMKEVVDKTSAMGYEYTLRAVTQHLQKLRRKEGAGGEAGAVGTPKTPKTPKTPRTPRKTPGTGKAASGRKRKNVDPAPQEDEDDDEAGPDQKKVKTEAGDNDRYPAEDIDELEI